MKSWVSMYFLGFLKPTVDFFALIYLHTSKQVSGHYYQQNYLIKKPKNGFATTPLKLYDLLIFSNPNMKDRLIEGVN